MDVNGAGYVLSLAQALTTGHLVQITWWIEAIVIAVILSTEVGQEKIDFCFSLWALSCSVMTFMPQIFFCFLFFDSVTAECWAPIVEVSEAGLPKFLEHRKRVGSFSLGWSKLQTVSLLMRSHFPKGGQLLSLFLSPPPTWVSSVDDHKVELVSFSSVGAVMDVVFLALDQGLAKAS